MKIDHSPFAHTVDDASGDSTLVFADALTVKARKKVSALLSSFSAAMKLAGVDEACRKFNAAQKLLPEEKRIAELNSNEIRRIYMTIMEAAQLTEWKAEDTGVACAKVRRFKCPAFAMELYYKRKQKPAHLAKKKELLSESDQKEKTRLINTLSRNWQRRFKKVHLVQCYMHLALVEKEDGVASEKKRIAPTYTDRLTDLLIDIGKRAGSKGEPIGRFNRAATEALTEFRAVKEHIYAPDFDAVVSPLPPAKKKRRISQSAPDPLKPVRTLIARSVKEAQALVRSEKLSTAQADQIRLDMHALLEEYWSGGDDSPTGNDGSTPLAAPVIVNTDTAPVPASASAYSMHNSPAPSADLLSKTEDSPDLDKTFVSYLNDPPPLWEATGSIEAFSSVGATKFKAVFVGIYPLTGEAERMGSEPKQKGDSMPAAEMIARLPEYLRLNREKLVNVAVRAWGPLIQVDDCSREVMERLKPFAFFIEQTSPDNWQVWLALPAAGYVGADGKRNDALVAVRTRLFKKLKQDGTTANGGAHGSTRLPGSLNIKEKFLSLPSFPRIRLEYVSLGRVVTPEELDAAGLLMPAPAPALGLIDPTPRKRDIFAQWPDYQYYVDHAPTKEDGNPNMNSADASFVIRCLSLGFTRAEVAAQLRLMRDKAAQRSDYVERTLNAAEKHLASQPAPGRERIAI
ncbi:MAG: hypothetical protein H0W99_00070 [Acidobacteria bacterium]|nr:hypothetical protein [Acidobacteriota bacterium]